MYVSCLDHLLSDSFVKKALATFPGIERHERRHPGVVQIKDVAHADPVIFQPADEEDVRRNLRRVNRLIAARPFGRASQRLPGELGCALVMRFDLETGFISDDDFPADKVHSGYD